MPSATHIAASSIISARSIDDVRPLKIICIGAGISGILAAIRIQERLKEFELVIYDKNEELGGTWYENKYPGCACGMHRRLILGYGKLYRLADLQTYLPIAINYHSSQILHGARFMQEPLKY